MQRRRALPGLKTLSPLRNDAEYRRALAELQVLGCAALGTPTTRGLQDLVDCILDYEISTGRHGAGDPQTGAPGPCRPGGPVHPDSGDPG